MLGFKVGGRGRGEGGGGGVRWTVSIPKELFSQF